MLCVYRRGREWLSSKAGLAISLPTEPQWQRAAQGGDGREYPWGNGFDSSRCNTSESGINHTTPVNQYPSGTSSYGVYDMAGNVWEWCLSEGENPENTALRLLYRYWLQELNEQGNMTATSEETDEHWILRIHRCSVCHGWHAAEPVCHLWVAYMQTAVAWFTGGQTVHPIETECPAMGHKACTFVVDKRTLGK